jgi:ribokinase
MTVDLAVATPAFLDLTFVGLEKIPGPGEERFAGDLMRSPGGGAITAIGAARLGLRTVLAAPLGQDVEGDMVSGALAREGVEVLSRRGARTATTVVLPVDGERSFVTYDPGVRANAGEVAALEPRAVAVSLDQLSVAPDGPSVYVTCGDDDARAYAGRPPTAECGARALFVNEKEAQILTGRRSPRDAAERLSACAEIVVVTLGRAGRSRSARARRSSCRATTSARPSTRPVRAICSVPRTPGPTCTAPTRTRACAGPACTRRSRSRRRPGWPAP